MPILMNFHILLSDNSHFYWCYVDHRTPLIILIFLDPFIICNPSLRIYWVKFLWPSFKYPTIRGVHSGYSNLYPINLFTWGHKGACSGAVGWGTALQTGRLRVRFPMVSLEFFIDLTQPLTEMSTRNISWRVKAASAEGWQPYHFHDVPIVLKTGSLKLLEHSGPVQACNGIALSLHEVIQSSQQCLFPMSNICMYFKWERLLYRVFISWT